MHREYLHIERVKQSKDYVVENLIPNGSKYFRLMIAYMDGHAHKKRRPKNNA